MEDILNGIEEITKAGKKKIPSFNLPRVLKFEVGGKPCTIRRASADISIPAMAKFGKLLGDTMGHIASYSDDNNPEKKTLKEMMGLDLDPGKIKTFLFTHALPQMFAQIPRSGQEIFELYYELVPGHFTIDGISIDNYDELKEVDLAGMMLWDVIFKTFEVNFYPTLGDQPTDVGEERPAVSEPKGVVPLVTKPRTKRPAGTAKGGRSGKMSRKSG